MKPLTDKQVVERLIERLGPLDDDTRAALVSLVLVGLEQDATRKYRVSKELIRTLADRAGDWSALIREIVDERPQPVYEWNPRTGKCRKVGVI